MATAAGLAGLTPFGGVTSIPRSVGSVTAGQLVTWQLNYWSDVGEDTLVAGDLTQTAGTATLGTISLDRLDSDPVGGGTYLHTAIYSAIVTGSGTLTLTQAGMNAGSYGLVFSEAFNGTWDGSRVEDADGATSATDNLTSFATPTVTSAAAAVFVAVLSWNTGGTGAGLAVDDGAWTDIGVSNDGVNYVPGAASYRIVATGTTDSAGWTGTQDGASYNGASASVVVYKEAAPSVSVDQEGARFGNDDGNEAAHTWAAAQDANITSPLGTALLIRALLNGTGDFASTAFALRYQKNGSGGYVAVPVGASTSPTLSYGATGTIAYSTSGGTSVAPTYPSGITTQSCLVLVVGQKPSSANGGTVTTPSGWTLQASLTGANDGNTGGYTTTLGADTGNCNIFVYTKDTVSGSESGTLSVTVGTNNVCWANIYRIQASAECTWSYAAGTGKDTAGGNVSIATGSMSIAAGDHVIGAMVIPTDVSTPTQFSAEALSQSGTTFGTVTEVEEPDSTTGNDIGGFVIQAPVSSGSGSGAVTMSATAGGTTTNVRGPGIVLRVRATGVARELYVATSSNIASGGEATTARLTAPSGKSTSDFVTGRRWDDENGTDSIDLTTDDYTEVEWCINAQSPAVNGDYFDFRVYAGASALGSYTVTPRWTLGTPPTPSLMPVQGATRRIPALLRF